MRLKLTRTSEPLWPLGGWFDLKGQLKAQETAIAVSLSGVGSYLRYESWVAAITGRIGELTPEGFILENPNIQAFERKPKAVKPDEES